MKKSVSILLSALMLVIFAALLSGCTSECEHKYGDEWKSDDSSHWHECIHECGKKVDSEAHIWGDAVVTTEPTCTEYGISKKTCIVCEAVMELPVEKKAHVFNETYDYDENGHWRQCMNCESRISSAHEFKNFGYDPTNHWYSCMCGAKNGVEAHTWDEGVENDDATLTQKCTNALCGATITGEDPNHQHVWIDGEILEQPTCTKMGIREKLCACGAKSTESISMTKHSYTSGDYQKNDTHHWRKCSCGANPSEADMIPHDFGDDYTVVGEYKVWTCVCGQEKKEIQQGYIDPDGWT